MNNLTKKNWSAPSYEDLDSSKSAAKANGAVESLASPNTTSGAATS